MRYLLLHRALHNAGDFLIRQRAHELVRAVRPSAEIIEADAWRPLHDQLAPSELSAVDAMVICGGPGIQRRMHPRVYPLQPLEALDRPLLLLSLGSYFFPADAASIASHRLDASTERFIRHVLAHGGLVSVRDELSEGLLRRHAIDEVLMTGDVAWYRPETTEIPDASPSIAHIAFTPPANPMFFADGLHLLHGLHRSYPEARITVVSHRDPQPLFDEAAARLGGEALSIAGSAAGFQIFDEASVHVGYRLHAHLYCLSGGRISYLVAEDSRGVGALKSLGPLGLDPFQREVGLSRRLVWPRLQRWGNPRRPITGTLGQLASRFTSFGDPSASIVAQIAEDRASAHRRHRAAFDNIARTRPVMNAALERLP